MDRFFAIIWLWSTNNQTRDWLQAAAMPTHRIPWSYRCVYCWRPPAPLCTVLWKSSSCLMTCHQARPPLYAPCFGGKIPLLMTAIRCSSAAALFVYGLFNDAVSSSDYMPSNAASRSGESAGVCIRLPPYRSSSWFFSLTSGKGKASPARGRGGP
jgi:hypothetical protein